MVKVSFEQKPYRRILMETYGATVHASPTEPDRRRSARAARWIRTPPVRSASRSPRPSRSRPRTRTPTTRSARCSTTCACTRRSSARRPSRRWQIAEDEPDVVIGCVGGGSNFAGIAFPYYHRKLEGKSNARLLAVEPKACPTLTAGEYRYDLGDEAGMTPQMLMYTLGHDFVPAGIHAGGLRYHGDSPLVSQLVYEGEAEAVAVDQTACFAAAVQFARAEGILPAPESSHAIRAAIDEALAAQGRRRGQDHPVQPVRPRSLRPRRLRRVQFRRAPGLRFRRRQPRSAVTTCRLVANGAEGEVLGPDSTRAVNDVRT